MKKKIISSFIAGLVCAGMLAGCGVTDIMSRVTGDGEDAETVSEAPVAEAIPGTEGTGDPAQPDVIQSQEPTPDAGSEDEQAVQASAGSPEVVIRKKFYYVSSDDEHYNKILSGHVQIPELSEESAEAYPELAATLKAEADQALKSYDDMVAESTEEAKDWYSEMDPEDFYASYLLDRDVIVKRADDRIVSFYLHDEQFFGGAHGIYGNFGYNYDTATGRKLELKDVLTDTDGLSDFIKAELERKYADQLDMFFDLDDSLAHYVPEEVPEDQDYSGDDYTFSYVWVYGRDGIEIYFGPYALAAYAAGAQTVTISCQEHPEMFDDRYLPASEGTGFIEYFNRFTDCYDVNGDGSVDNIGIENEYVGDDYENPTGLSVYVNDTYEKVPEECDLAFPDEASGYFVHLTDGRDLIYITCPSYNDFIDLVVYDVTGGNLKYVGVKTMPSFYYRYNTDDEYNCEFVLYDPDRMHFAERYDYICTFNAFKIYHVGADGMPETDDKEAVIYESVGWEPIASVKAFEAECIDDAANPEKITIEAGETFELTATDGETYVDAVISDGRKVRLHVQGRGMDLTVNGENAQDLFKELMYAG